MRSRLNIVFDLNFRARRWIAHRESFATRALRAIIVICVSRRERGWSVQISIRKWKRKRIRNLSRGRRLTGSSMRPSSGGESCTWWELDDLWQQPCGEHKELHTSVNKWEKRDSSLTSVLAKIVRTMKKSYFVFVSTEFFIAQCTCINYGCLSVNGKKPLLGLLEPLLGLFEPLFSSFFNFFLSFSWPPSLQTWWENRSNLLGLRRIYAFVQTLACFTRKIKGQHHFNLSMATVSFSYPFEWSNFWMRSLRARVPSCPFVAHTTLVLYSPRTVKLTT